MLQTKDPAKVRAGRAGMRSRWGDHVARVVRLDDLTQPQRVLVLSLIAAAKAANEMGPAVLETPAGPSSEGTRDASDAA